MNRRLQTEGRVILVDGILATAVLVGLVVHAAIGGWWGCPWASRACGPAARERADKARLSAFYDRSPIPGSPLSSRNETTDEMLVRAFAKEG